ncbi:MAG TPA: nucleotidyltransferase [Fervidobacterium sp.]|nr:nucleotidyltransferase [Fervidobacterium sp.]HQE49725.1 nucleotidyltransferase [Fervidobacterium sp.]HUM43620.1 nucleotidyltransferase [Fervidobacterium sp.]
MNKTSDENSMKEHIKVLGIVVEYNPLHFGHLNHIHQSIELVNPDYVIAVMSGNFCQRGEPAIINKFARTEIALRYGIDIVLELPTVYAIQDAGGFALGSIGILERTGVVTDIVFGSESGDLEFISKIAHLLTYQSPEFEQSFKRQLKKGYSYPNARKYALMEVIDDGMEKLSKPNDILGIEYVRALLKYDSKIKPHAIQRVGADYSDETYRGQFSSASAIRKAISHGEFCKISNAVPEWTLKVMESEFEKGRGPVFWNNMEFVLAMFRKMKREDFENIYSFNEGLDLRFVESARATGDFQDFVDRIKTKRFTYSRIRRAILHVLFEMRKKEVELSDERGPQYLRILGFTEKGRELLRIMKKSATIPMISTASLYKNVLDETQKKISEGKGHFEVEPELYIWQFERDILASDLYTLMYPNKKEAAAGMDFRQPVRTSFPSA